MKCARRFTDGSVPIRTEGFADAECTKTEDHMPSSDCTHQLLCLTWEPGPGVKRRGIVQIVHGMIEFVDRYDDIARFFASNGFIVVGEDHIGHGGSVESPDEWGQLPGAQGADILVADVHALRLRTQGRYGEDLPYFVYGHSMGSFITRAYLMEHGEGLAGAIISGTGQMAGFASGAASGLARIIGVFHGKNYHSAFINNIGFGGYNKMFEPARTPYDWLTKDEAVVDRYAAEPRDTFTFTVDGYVTLLTLTGRIVNDGQVARIRTDLPILVAAGGDDPVGECGKGPRAAADQLRAHGNPFVTTIIYPGDRHEIHNELDRLQVYTDFLDWIDAVLSGAAPSGEMPPLSPAAAPVADAAAAGVAGDAR